MTEHNHVENEDSPVVIQADLLPVFLFCPFNMADSKLIALLIHTRVDWIITTRYKNHPTSKKETKYQQKTNLLMTAFRIYWMFSIVASSIVESSHRSSPVATSDKDQRTTPDI